MLWRWQARLGQLGPRLVLSLLLAGAFSTRATPAAACSCSATTSLIVPSEERGVSRDGPLLVAAPRGTTFELRALDGSLRDLSPVVASPALGGCEYEHSLLVPAEPLDPNQRYVLVSDFLGYISESEPFAVAQGDLGVETASVEVSANLELTEPDVLTSGLCAPPELVDRRVETWLHVSVSAPIETPLILTVRTEDEVAGTLVHSSTPYGSEHKGYLGLVMPLPDEAARCVDVELVDLRATPVFREVLCLEPDAPVQRSFSATLPAVPDSPRDTGTTAEASDSCSLSQRSPSSRPFVLGWGAALLFALAWRRRRKRATTSRVAENARASLRAAG